MLRITLATLLLATLAAAWSPSAAACCHLYDDPEGNEVGPCVVGWEGDLFHGGEHAYADCEVAGENVSAEVPLWQELPIP